MVLHYEETYAPFREPLTAEQQKLIDESPNPTEAYCRIAIETAEKQLSVACNTGREKSAMPENDEVAVRFPGVDPVGKYSVIDMKPAQRMLTISATLQMRDGAVRERVNAILASEPSRALYAATEQAARRHRTLTRAEKLCHDRKAAERLHMEARRLESDESVVGQDMLLQGIEYLIGIREEPIPQEIGSFYRDRLHTELTEELRETCSEFMRPKNLDVHFQDFDHKILQLAFSMPENWGADLEELEALADVEETEENAE